MTLVYIFASLAAMCGAVTFVSGMLGATAPTIENSERWSNLAVDGLTAAYIFLLLAFVGLFFV